MFADRGSRGVQNFSARTSRGARFQCAGAKGGQDFNAPGSENSSTPRYTLIMTAPLASGRKGPCFRALLEPKRDPVVGQMSKVDPVLGQNSLELIL